MTESTEPSAPDAPTAPAAPVAPSARCANCGQALLGPHCYACGQPVKGLVRHLSGIVGDFFDSVFDLDSRTLRTIAPLFFRPGYLAVEYFAGRRVRYVTPLRLFFFMSVVAFFSVQLYVDQSGFADKGFIFDADSTNSLSTAKTPEEVHERLTAALSGLDAAQVAPGVPQVATKAIGKAQMRMQAQAKARLAYLASIEAARAKNLPVPPDPNGDENVNSIQFDGVPWDPKTHPLHVDWLPEVGNAKLNEMVGNMRENVIRARKEPKRLLIGLLGVLPATLFVLMPLFAVLLKVLYLFKRRLYMEHLIIALHSHAFIFFSLLVISLLGLLGIAVPSIAPWLHSAMTLIAWWVPLYLLLMQKTVYKQNWVMTLFKFALVGTAYSVMIVIATSVAFVLSLTSST